MENFFCKATKFSPPDENGNIEIDKFLQAAKEMVPFFDVLGTAFKPVKSDIEGNVTRIDKRYSTNPEKFCIMRSILEDEVERKCADDKQSTTQAILWFKRALEYMSVFLQQIVDDHKSGTKTENLGAFARRAYEQSLKNYHGWFVQKIFAVVSRAVPWRRDLLKTLNNGSGASEDQLIADMEAYVNQIHPIIVAVQTMLTDMKLDFQYKV